ncbi:MAG: ABC transporter permease, partial [Bradyrhizobium sp.]|nr:ABC transporter permease [Bradyrhizobium sp.]
MTAIAVLALILIVSPSLVVVIVSFTSGFSLKFPPQGYSTRWFRELVTADSWRLSIVNSLLIGAGTTALATLLGTLAALGLRGRRASLVFSTLRTVFLLPMVVPAVVLGVGMQLMFSRCFC